MADNQFPKDAIFIKWGRFQAGATGRLAVTALVLVIVAVLAGYAFGFW